VRTSVGFCWRGGAETLSEALHETGARLLERREELLGSGGAMPIALSSERASSSCDSRRCWSLVSVSSFALASASRRFSHRSASALTAPSPRAGTCRNGPVALKKAL
jgi:hypothetical protein